MTFDSRCLTHWFTLRLFTCTSGSKFKKFRSQKENELGNCWDVRPWLKVIDELETVTISNSRSKIRSWSAKMLLQWPARPRVSAFCNSAPCLAAVVKGQYTLFEKASSLNTVWKHRCQNVPPSLPPAYQPSYRVSGLFIDAIHICDESSVMIVLWIMR